MKRFLFLMLLAFSTRTYGQTKADEAQINKILDEYMAVGSNTKKLNFGVLLNNATEDASWVNIVGMRWSGRETLRKAFYTLFEEQKMFKDVPFEKKSTIIRFATPEVAIAHVVTHVGAFYPPDGVNRGNNMSPAADEMGTMVFVKKNGRWLFTAGQNTVVDARAVDPMKKVDTAK